MAVGGLSGKAKLRPFRTFENILWLRHRWKTATRRRCHGRPQTYASRMRTLGLLQKSCHASSERPAWTCAELTQIAEVAEGNSQLERVQLNSSGVRFHFRLGVGLHPHASTCPESLEHAT